MLDMASRSNPTDGSRPYGSLERRPTKPCDNDLQRADGFSRIVLSGSKKGARIVDVFQRSPIRVMFPRVGGAIEEAVLVNTGGGVAGGDRVESGVKGLAQGYISGGGKTGEKG